VQRVTCLAFENFKYLCLIILDFLEVRVALVGFFKTVEDSSFVLFSVKVRNLAVVEDVVNVFEERLVDNLGV
jgi:hypothetical protein